MVAYLPSGRRSFRVKVEVAPGVRVTRSTETRDRVLAKKMQATLDALGSRGHRAYDLLGKLRSEWSVRDLCALSDRHRGDVDAMRKEARAIALSSVVESFLAEVERTATQDTANHYATAIATLDPQGITRVTDLTVAQLSRWLTALPHKAGTARKYAAGVSAFCGWLVRHGHLHTNPMRDVPKPSVPPSRVSFLETADAIRLADAQDEPFRAFSALLAGTALDVSALLGVTRAQVDLDAWTITLRRPKTNAPQTVVVAEWSRPYLTALCKGAFPNTSLFESIDRHSAGKAHRAACRSLGIDGYWMRDARHTWAVRWARVNGSPAQAAEQLGHKDGGVLFLSTYGRFRPTTAERQATETRAAERDAHHTSRRQA